MLPEPHLIVMSHMDDVSSKHKFIDDDVELKIFPMESQKLEDVGKIKVIVGRSPNLMNDDELSKTKEK